MPESLKHELELLRHTSVIIECAFVKRYFSSIVILMRLSRSERIFLDFITEEMDENNYITNSFQVRQRFNALLKKVGQETYSDSTLHKCFSGLAEHNLLYKMKGRGLYQVSPLFFYKGSEEERAKLIRQQLEEINRIPINDFRRRLILESIFSLEQEGFHSND